MELLLWVRVGDAGEPESFDCLGEAIDYLNRLKVGQITRHSDTVFETPNYHHNDCIRVFWGGIYGAFEQCLKASEWADLGRLLEENHL